MLVYLVTNRINGKKYVGKTITSLAHRWSQHCCPTSGCVYLSAAIKEHGKEAFTIEKIGTAETATDLAILELQMIDAHSAWNPSGYNATQDDISKKISQTQLGVKRGPQPRERSVRRKESLIKATGIAAVGVNLKSGEAVFLRYTNAAKAIGFDPVSIRQCIHGRYKQYRGYKWMRYDDFMSQGCAA